MLTITKFSIDKILGRGVVSGMLKRRILNRSLLAFGGMALLLLAPPSLTSQSPTAAAANFTANDLKILFFSVHAADALSRRHAPNREQLDRYRSAQLGISMNNLQAVDDIALSFVQKQEILAAEARAAQLAQSARNLKMSPAALRNFVTRRESLAEMADRESNEALSQADYSALAKYITGEFRLTFRARTVVGRGGKR
ncbi:MAG: hypothetical protein IT170_08705 [Bryobacterales bacterium]|nr:hypothetical protein [Bryobacterales bacterium]